MLGGGAVRALHLGGLGVPEAQVLLASHKLDGTSQEWGELNARYGGNGLALKVVGETIRELFRGDIGTFLPEAGDGNVFAGIRRLLAEQVDRSSALEQQVLRLLAVDGEPVSIGQIIAELGPSVGRGAALEAVEALRRRSLAERADARSGRILPAIGGARICDRSVGGGGLRRGPAWSNRGYARAFRAGPGCRAAWSVDPAVDAPRSGPPARAARRVR